MKNLQSMRMLRVLRVCSSHFAGDTSVHRAREKEWKGDEWWTGTHTLTHTHTHKQILFQTGRAAGQIVLLRR